MFNILLKLSKILLLFFSLFIRAFFIMLPALLVLLVLTNPEIIANRGIPVMTPANKQEVHEIFPNSRWGDFKPCGEFFNEEEEFNKAISCVNENVWPEKKLREDLTIPRCFVVSAQSPDIFSSKDGSFNFVPVLTLFGRSAVVGVYQPDTKTVFVVENVDAPDVYRHELQHFFLHEHDPESKGGGHFQSIWKTCEPPYYTPSFRSKMIAAARQFKEDN